MASPSSLRPVLALGLAAALTACGSSEADADRFETMAEAVAAVPLGDRATPGRDDVPPAVAVEVLSPHALWDARDADSDAVQRVAAAAAPTLARAVVSEARGELARVIHPAPADPAVDPIEADAGAGETPQVRPQSAELAPRAPGLVQLGAFADEAAARAAWTRLTSGSAAWALEGLAPIYEPARVGDRTVVRLKTLAPGAGAAALCAAAGIDDPWCHRGG